MRHAALLVTALVGMAVVAGCGSAHAAGVGLKTSTNSGGAEGKGRSCGQAHTAGHVPVVLAVTSGTVTCSEAQQVEAAYGHDITAGLAPGNGGGGPVPVDGWTCQGLPTPKILRTGQVSKCAKGGSEFDAVLASSAPSRPSTPSTPATAPAPTPT